MSHEPLGDVVASQYSRWMYPEPIQDLPAWLAGNWQWFDPSHAHRIFWPDRGYHPGMDILIAGCGTNQAAVFAYTNPGARVVAIDVSEPSLNHHRVLVDRYGMHNLDLRQLPIEEVGSLGRDFDLIVSTGVLHHLADPLAGMQALARCLRPEGVMGIMLYARHGRIGVEMLQGVFRDLGLRQDEASLGVVRDAIAALPPDHPLRSYLALAPDVTFDAGLVDTFLHGRDRSYTVDDCLDLVASAGLVFQEWFLKTAYYPPASPGGSFHAAVSALPERKQWSVMERINSRNACHFFTACHPERCPDTYRIDFTSGRVADFVPSLRYRCNLAGDRLSRYDWSVTLDPIPLALVRQIDGRRSIREIAASAAAQGGAAAQATVANLTTIGVKLCQSLWQRDFLAMGLPS